MSQTTAYYRNLIVAHNERLRAECKQCGADSVAGCKYGTCLMHQTIRFAENEAGSHLLAIYALDATGTEYVVYTSQYTTREVFDPSSYKPNIVVTNRRTVQITINRSTLAVHTPEVFNPKIMQWLDDILMIPMFETHNNIVLFPNDTATFVFAKDMPMVRFKNVKA